ncbi:CHAT domain-containing protein [Nostoc sp. FACHB-152]|uniref:CHAT domain-containing protein n=1 Tax=unclassified Nostoc TaxID=2593658 RepID=UPI0016866384|nr:MULTISPECIES: CHAT domain-containing protein [unclassified Nostoc]MBD2449664.1 CHAT domain-containing protein [Nostoc sp. FACHB-152]MBD2469672.1 CHAT domain-containing protein [Nostoc sp. FACHB-145]
MKVLIRFVAIALLGLLLSLGIHPLIPVSAKPVAQHQELALMQVGKQHYDAGQFLAASQIWQQAAQEYEQAGDRTNQALALSFVSLATQQLGQWQQAQAAIDTSLSLLDNSGKASGRIRAQVLNALARLQLIGGKAQLGNDAAQEALKTWQAAETLYREAGDSVGVMGSQINQAQALQTLGLYRQARKLLTQISQSLEQSSDSRLKITGLRTLSDIFQQTGELEASQKMLVQALAIAEKLELHQDKTITLLSLGNTARVRKQTQKALEYYQQTETVAANKFPQLRMQAQLNRLSLLIETQQWEQAQKLGLQIPKPLTILPPGRSTMNAQVNLAKNLICLQLRRNTPICPLPADKENQISQAKTLNESSNSIIISLLNTAVQQAENLQDSRTQSYALGNLGQFYEQRGEWQQAKEYTTKALNLSQQIQAADISYQWQWQLGRLLKQENDITGAIAAYSQAVKSLQSLRSDLVTLNPDIQFGFREQVEPVYRELVNLLLQAETPNQENLKQAREAIEALQLAELDNFFRDACAQAKPEQLDQIVDSAATPTAVFYGIVLSDRLEFVLKLPKQSQLLHYRTLVSQAEVESTLKQLQQRLTQPKPSKELPQLSQKVYNWLLRQAEPDLANNSIDTLVFVLDFSLQNIPLAVLDDGKQYLVQKYALALSPGLQLIESRPLTQIKLNVLTAGISERRYVEGKNFDSLNQVPIELDQIQAEVSRSKKLLNSDLSTANLRKAVESVPFSVIHLATHGNFSSNPDETFVLLWDRLLEAKNFDQLLRSGDRINARAIELLTLSACETATGDKRATLGLAGIAVRAGARSTLATLWQVKDDSTAAFAIQFYKVLQNDKLTKAQALRQAQLYLMEKHPNTNYRLPYYWAPFVLVGNWL